MVKVAYIDKKLSIEDIMKTFNIKSKTTIYKIIKL